MDIRTFLRHAAQHPDQVLRFSSKDPTHETLAKPKGKWQGRFIEWIGPHSHHKQMTTTFHNALKAAFPNADLSALNERLEIAVKDGRRLKGSDVLVMYKDAERVWKQQEDTRVLVQHALGEWRPSNEEGGASDLTVGLPDDHPLSPSTQDFMRELSDPRGEIRQVFEAAVEREIKAAVTAGYQDIPTDLTGTARHELRERLMQEAPAKLNELVKDAHARHVLDQADARLLVEIVRAGGIPCRDEVPLLSSSLKTYLKDSHVDAGRKRAVITHLVGACKTIETDTSPDLEADYVVVKRGIDSLNALLDERDASIQALLTPDTREAMSLLLEDLHGRRAALEKDLPDAVCNDFLVAGGADEPDAKPRLSTCLQKMAQSFGLETLEHDFLASRGDACRTKLRDDLKKSSRDVLRNSAVRSLTHQVFDYLVSNDEGPANSERLKQVLLNPAFGFFGATEMAAAHIMRAIERLPQDQRARLWGLMLDTAEAAASKATLSGQELAAVQDICNAMLQPDKVGALPDALAKRAVKVKSLVVGIEGRSPGRQARPIDRPGDEFAWVIEAIDRECANTPVHRMTDSSFESLDTLLNMANTAYGGAQVFRTADGDPNVSASNRKTLDGMRDDFSKVRDAGATAGEQRAFLSAQYRHLTALFIEQAVEACGQPPFGFAVMTVGSASRGEASPYSDIEFVIVLDKTLSEDEVQIARAYVQRVSAMVKIQVTALGESGGLGQPLGLHWDTGSLTPLEDPNRLIARPQDLIQTAFGRDALDLHMTMFMNTELLIGFQGYAGNAASGIGVDEGRGHHRATEDHEHLVQEFHAQVEHHMAAAAPGQKPNGFGIAQQMLRNIEGLLKENLPSHLLSQARQSPETVEVDVKVLSRLPFFLANALCLAHGLLKDGPASGFPDHHIHSTEARIQALAVNGLLTRDQADRLLNAFDAVTQARIDHHVQQGHGESDTVSLSDHPALQPAIEILLEFEQGVKETLMHPDLLYPQPIEERPTEITKRPSAYAEPYGP